MGVWWRSSLTLGSRMWISRASWAVRSNPPTLRNCWSTISTRRSSTRVIWSSGSSSTSTSRRSPTTPHTWSSRTSTSAAMRLNPRPPRIVPPPRSTIYKKIAVSVEKQRTHFTSQWTNKTSPNNDYPSSPSSPSTISRRRHMTSSQSRPRATITARPSRLCRYRWRSLRLPWLRRSLSTLIRRRRSLASRRSFHRCTLRNWLLSWRLVSFNSYSRRASHKSTSTTRNEIIYIISVSYLSPHFAEVCLELRFWEVSTRRPYSSFSL